MKRFFTVVFVLATAVAFGSWPASYQGDELPTSSCFGFVAEVVEWEDHDPWGMISPVGVKTIGEVCEQDGVAIFDIQWIVSREHCTEPPWGARDQVETCTYYVYIDWQEPPRHLPFVDGAYIAYVHEPGNIVPYEAFVWDDDSTTGVYVDGVFDFVTPLWFYESNEHTRWRWSVVPLGENDEVITKRAVGGRKGRRDGGR